MRRRTCERVVAAAARRPRRVLAVAGGAGGGGRGARPRALHRARRRARWSASGPASTRRPSATASASGTTRSWCWSAGRSRTCADVRPQPADRPRGVPVGQHAGGRDAVRGEGLAVRAAARRRKPVQVVYGPGTFINSAVGEIHDQLQAQLKTQGGRRRSRRPRAARKLAAGRGRARRRSSRRARRPRRSSTRGFLRDVLALNVKYGLGIDQLPSARTTRTSCPRWCSTRHAGRRRPRRASPTCSRARTSALIQVRLKPDLTEAQRTAAIRDGPRRPWRCRSGSSTAPGRATW